MISKYRIFVFIFIPAVLALAGGMVLIQQKNSEISSVQFEDQLRDQWRLAALLVEDPARRADLSSLNKISGLRVTLIERNGHVLFDSAAEGPLESHQDREEIKNAMADKPSMAVRHSRTTNRHTIYYAQKIPDGRILRVAYPAAFYDRQREALMNHALVGLTALMALVALFALIISNNLSKVMNSLSLAVKEAQNGGCDLPSFNNEDVDNALFSLSAATRELRRYGEENLGLRRRLEYILGNIDEGVLLLSGNAILYHNRRAGEILNFRIPENIGDIDHQEMIRVFASFTAGQTGEVRLGEKSLAVTQTVSEDSRLIMLHDISDREKYSGYKADLVGNISHELKTPLTLIMAAAEVILKDADMPRAFLDKFLTTIHKNTQRINLLLDNLIFLHQLEGGKDIEPAETDLEELVNDLQELLGQQVKEIGYAYRPGRVKIHATHLISILTNLINNAVKYSQGRRIQVEMNTSGAVLEIQVADQGPIIAVSERERIFERFYSLSQSRNREKSGTGLGLSIVKHIARIYKGQALVEPNDMGGNTFVVRLVERN